MLLLLLLVVVLVLVLHIIVTTYFLSNEPIQLCIGQDCNGCVFVLTELEKQMKIENLFVTWQQRSAQSNMPISVSTQNMCVCVCVCLYIYIYLSDYISLIILPLHSFS